MFKVATINLAGMRGSLLTGKASKVGFGADTWFKSEQFDIVAFQETRILSSDVAYLKCLEMLGIQEEDIYLLPDAYKKGHGGVALYLNPKTCKINSIRAQFENETEAEKYCFSGRWLEADIEVAGHALTVISAYFHHADSPTVKLSNGKLISRSISERTMDSKHKFMNITTARMRELINANRELLLLGDVNIAHTELDLKNWRGNKTKAGFLPEERAWLSLWFANSDDDINAIYNNYKKNNIINYTPPKTSQFQQGTLELVDICRQIWGSESIYSWWSNRGHAFDNNSGWRIDYQIATPKLAAYATTARVCKQEAYDKRWSDHAPVVVEFE
ncbi:MAG: endonuclease/exonuclease/phosphatase family protein [Candidatus Ancillula sp.]|jgi:exodeoxyribonuclease-3|nr:endonuclease/exonuclease/phosphatase family protein [Candidatus Ancillula sp.]